MEMISLRVPTEPELSKVVNDTGINRTFTERLKKYLEDDVRELLSNRLRADAEKLTKNLEEYGNETEL